MIDGPFAEAKELIAGFWLIQVKSKEEAIEWAKRVPSIPTCTWAAKARSSCARCSKLEDFGESAAVEHHREQGKELAKKKVAVTQPSEEESHASSTLPVLRRPLRRGLEFYAARSAPRSRC